MTWEKGQYGGVGTVTFPSNMVWMPDLAIANAVDKLTTLNDLDEIVTTVRYTNDGLTLWGPGSAMKTICTIRIKAYPFDVHEFSIDIVIGGLLFGGGIKRSLFR